MNTTHANSTTGLKDNLPYIPIPVYAIFMYGIYVFLCFPLNAYIIVYLVSRRRGLDTLPDLNLAIADSFFLLLVPFYCLCSLKLEWCLFKPVGFFLTIIMSARTLFQCWVCVERYLAVIHPVMFLRYKPIRYRLGCSMLLWTAALTFGITGMLTFPNMPYKIFTAFFLTILTVEIFCGMSILKGLRRPGPRDMGKEEGDISAAKKKAFRKVAINLLIFLIQNIPVTIIFALQNNLTLYAFKIAVTICLAINILTGLLQSISVLQRVGKLSFIKYILFPTCCSCATMSPSSS